MPRSTKSSPLLTFLRSLTTPQRLQFAAAVGTTDRYLRQLSTQEFPNPSLRTGLAIQKESARLAGELNAARKLQGSAEQQMVALSLEDLLVVPKGGE